MYPLFVGALFLVASASAVGRNSTSRTDVDLIDLCLEYSGVQVKEPPNGSQHGTCDLQVPPKTHLISRPENKPVGDLPNVPREGVHHIVKGMIRDAAPEAMRPVLETLFKSVWFEIMIFYVVLMAFVILFSVLKFLLTKSRAEARAYLLFVPILHINAAAEVIYVLRLLVAVAYFGLLGSHSVIDGFKPRFKRRIKHYGRLRRESQRAAETSRSKRTAVDRWYQPDRLKLWQMLQKGSGVFLVCMLGAVAATGAILWALGRIEWTLKKIAAILAQNSQPIII